MFNQALFSSEDLKWETPQWLFDYLNKLHKFDLDVCATPQTAKCKKYFTPAQNGLSKSWAPNTCWMNPPYGREISKWMAKANAEARKGATVVCLVPARVDTIWWWSFARQWDVTFLKGRLKFGNAKNSAPFPSAIVKMGKKYSSNTQYLDPKTIKQSR